MSFRLILLTIPLLLISCITANETAKIDFVVDLGKLSSEKKPEKMEKGEKPEKFVTILGAVNRPGTYRYREGLSVIKLIGYAGGLSEDARTSDIKLIRNHSGMVYFDYDDFIDNADYSKNYKLEENDIVFVSTKVIARFAYYVRQIPILQFFAPSTTLNPKDVSSPE